MARTKKGGAAAAAAATAALSNMPDDELTRLMTAAQDALTDSMVERMSTTAGNALEIVDRLNDELTRDAIHTIIDQVTELHRNGGLQTLFEVVALVHAARNAATDSIVERLFAFTEYMLSNVATEEMAELLDNVRCSLNEAAKESQEESAGGVLKTMRMLSTPEAQATIRMMLLFGEKFQARARG